jgi:hypothetical protein
MGNQLAPTHEVDTEGDITDATKDKTPPPLTEAYQKARAHYAVAAGLLLSWDLVGLTIEATQEVAGVKIQMAAPQAAPFAILAVMLYCSIRTAIEWYQCDPVRRRLPWPQVDVTLGHALGVAAISLFAFQRLATVSVGQYLVAPVGVRLFVSSCAGLFLGFTPGRFWGLRKFYADPHTVPRIIRSNIIRFLVAAPITFAMLRSSPLWHWVFPIFTALLGFGWALWFAAWIGALEEDALNRSKSQSAPNAAPDTASASTPTT